ncbi:hypothetical protein, partial [Cetobacterium sp.]|uniref:hypothetical protein n=1 Tax=Cetobacterium sp. TaxID=2071632 RepID=UPI003F414613
MYNLLLTCKYKLIGTYNDLKKNLINILRFYGTSIIISVISFVFLINCGIEIVGVEVIRKYINYILPVIIILIICGYMFTSFSIIIFSKPNIFYLLRNKKLFKQIAWIKLFQQNTILIGIVLAISYFLSFSLRLVSFKDAFSLFLLIPCSLNLKYYIFNKKNTNKAKILAVLFFSVQLLNPILFLIIIEYLIIIIIVGNVLNDLDLENLIALYECLYDYGRIIKGDNINGGKYFNSSENIASIEKNIFFNFKKNKIFFLKDWKVIKNRPASMNIMLVIFWVILISLSIIFKEYK